MKQKKITVKKKSFSLKNAIPRFVSIVGQGANLMPLSSVQFSDKEESSVDIAFIRFSKEQFVNASDVEAWANNKGFEGSILEHDDFWELSDEASDKFSEISPIEFEEGVSYFIGKTDENKESEVTKIEEVEEFSTESKEQVIEEVTDEPTEVISESEEVETTEEISEVEETVSESDTDAEAEPQEETVVEVDEVSSETSEEVVQESDVAEEVPEISDRAPIIFAKDDSRTFVSMIEESRNRGTLTINEMIYAVGDAIYYSLYSEGGSTDRIASEIADFSRAITSYLYAVKGINFSDTEEKVEEIKNNDVDNRDIVIQNSNSVTNTEEAGERTIVRNLLTAEESKNLLGI